MADADVIVVGAGVMGLSAAWWLARRGRDAMVLDRFAAGHDRGGSHGPSRIFRLAYPDPDYVRLAQLALPLWRELEGDVGEELLVVTGGVDHGPPAVVTEIADALRAAGAACDVIPHAEAEDRFPGMNFEGVVCVQPDAASIRADRVLFGLQRRAVELGARVVFEESVTQVTPTGAGARVTTTSAEYQAAVVILTAGAWTPELVPPSIPLPAITVTQEQTFHFASARDVHWPAFIHYGARTIYGLRSPGMGIKVAEHHGGSVVGDLQARTFVVDRDARRRIEEYVDRWLPGLATGVIDESTCLYDSTPSDDFVVDRRGDLVIGAGFSGHGFKFAPLVGRFLADLATDQWPAMPTSFALGG